MFAKLENGVLIPAPDVLTDENGVRMYLPTEHAYAKLGYKKVRETQKPDGENLIAHFIEAGEEIVQEWIENALPETAEEKLDRLRDAVTALNAAHPVQAIAELLKLVKEILRE